jgi:hypothetical protein
LIQYPQVASKKFWQVSCAGIRHRAKISPDAKGDRGDGILLKEAKLDLTASVDPLKIEIEALKSYIERHHPDFAESYPKLKEEAIQTIDPEWLVASEERKQ